jgi:hypothetical protein
MIGAGPLMSPVSTKLTPQENAIELIEIALERLAEVHKHFEAEGTIRCEAAKVLRGAVGDLRWARAELGRMVK